MSNKDAPTIKQCRFCASTTRKFHYAEWDGYRRCIQHFIPACALAPNVVVVPDYSCSSWRSGGVLPEVWVDARS